MSKVETTGDLIKVSSKLEQLDVNLETQVRNKVDRQAESLVKKIDEFILMNGLVSGPDDEKDQKQLLGSFYSKWRGSNKWRITSDVPHATPLEVGSRGRDPEIAARNKKRLKFKDQNGHVIYPVKIPLEGYTDFYGKKVEPTDGHPGNQAYNYATDATNSWWPIASKKIDSSVKKSILLSGFKPDTR